MMAFFRLLKIIHVVAFYHIDELIQTLPYSFFPRTLIKLLPSYWLFYFSSQRKNNVNERLRLALIELGPVFIKLGQLLATRRDLLPDALANELEQLTENVPPFSSKEAMAIVEQELQYGSQQGSQKEASLFKSIDKRPMASASIAQVHAAELKTGEQVVLKILRPGIEGIVKRDIALMAWLAGTIEAWLSDARLFYLSDLVSNYREVIFGEMNFYREAANTIRMRKHALQHDYLYIPKVYLELSSRKVLCLERIYGIPVNQAEKIEAQGTDLKKLAENGVKIFFTQVFKDNFFHADMHPGNIFVNTVQPEANQYVSVDCAISASLSREDQLFLAQQLLALIQKNYLKNAQLFIDAGWVDKDIHKEELAFRLEKIVEPIFDQNMSEIDFAPILLELFAMAREFHMHINPNFLLFQKTLIHIEGLGKQLYPELNVWEVGKPLLEEWVKALLSPKALAEAIKENAPDLLQQLPELPALAFEALNQLKHGENTRQKELELLLSKLDEKQRQRNKGMLVSLALIGGAFFLGSSASLASLGSGSLILGGLGFSLLTYQLVKR
jgi:ubiquinone biosynthesis protein